MPATAYSHIKVWEEFSKESLTREDAARAVTESLKLPWMKRFQVFSDQGVLLVELHTNKYLYASPSMKNITGYEPNEFVDFHFIASLLSQEELEVMVEVSKIFVTRMAERCFLRTTGTLRRGDLRKAISNEDPQSRARRRVRAPDDGGA